MSTKKLTQPITVETSATIFERGHRAVIITIEPSGVLGLRLKGCTRTYALDLSACYHAAVKREHALACSSKKKKGAR